MTRRRRVDHHESFLTLLNQTREGAKHGNLLGAWGVQILFEQRTALRVQSASRRAHHFIGVCARLRLRVDSAHADPVGSGTSCESITSGICGREMHAMALPCEFGGDYARNGGLADAAFSHGHDDAAPRSRYLGN